MDSNGSSRTLRSRGSTTSIFIPTPSTSIRGDTVSHSSSQPTSPLLTIPSGRLSVTTLSANSWRTAYPRIGQFAMTESEEVVAAGPSGLFFLKRVQDHDSKPWSEGRPLPNTPMLNDSSVSGLAVISTRRGTPRLYVYCVSGNKLYSFYRSQENDSSWVKDPDPPLSSYLVSGTPAVALNDEYDNGSMSNQWSLVIPCQSGGLLHTSTYNPELSYLDRGIPWERVDYFAESLGVISSVSIIAVRVWGKSGFLIHIVMVCVASGRLHIVEGGFSIGYNSGSRWVARTPTRIHHPGEVTGNPILVKKDRGLQLDLLVPSAEGGIFHFVRTPTSLDEWHMIARITFPPSLPVASCLAIHSRDHGSNQPRKFYALIQSGGRLYHIETFESAYPWSGSYLKPIVAPGPSSD
ncbi:hypothetical protein GQX73_g8967 [Xylaria multiplex]|uniref:Fucose-specific lectin n=1 Tax=Xylaria multiplex TaxID=323545 RepID=A0A7C8MNY3_9PEZI|nr:hypothetical protein GQX73_g8967 [Xylaria multiplex]